MGNQERLISNKKIVNAESVLYIYELKKPPRPATKEEFEIYEVIKPNIINKMGFLSESEIYKRHQANKFYTKVNKKMSEALDSKVNCYTLLQITLNQEHIIPTEDCLKEVYKEELKLKLNSLIIESLTESFNKRYIKYINSRKLCQKCLEHSMKEHSPDAQWRPYFCIPCLLKDKDIKIFSKTIKVFSKTDLNKQLYLTEYFIRDEYLGVIDNYY